MYTATFDDGAGNTYSKTVEETTPGSGIFLIKAEKANEADSDPGIFAGIKLQYVGTAPSDGNSKSTSIQLSQGIADKLSNDLYTAVNEDKDKVTGKSQGLFNQAIQDHIDENSELQKKIDDINERADQKLKPLIRQREAFYKTSNLLENLQKTISNYMSALYADK